MRKSRFCARFLGNLSRIALPVRRFCAELVAAILQQGGLMSSDSNPGSATPCSLYKLYASRAAATANP